MQKEAYEFTYEVYSSIDELNNEDRSLLEKAMEITANAYAPYSNFQVGAAARLQNGKLVTGSNQENASFPAGLCAERVLLAAAASLYPNAPIETIALSYRSESVQSNHPISPCGICRQSLQEFE